MSRWPVLPARWLSLTFLGGLALITRVIPGGILGLDSLLAVQRAEVPGKGGGVASGSWRGLC